VWTARSLEIMADRDVKAGREQREEMKEIERSVNKDTASQEEAAAHAQGAEERKEPEQENRLCQSRVEPNKADRPRKAKRKEARKVATVIKRVRKDKGSFSNENRSELEISSESTANELSRERIPANEPKGTCSPWNTQQQETVSAYARARGMEPEEVLLVLVTLMEKSLCKEVGKDQGKKPLKTKIKRRCHANSAHITRVYTLQRDRNSFCEENDFTKTHFHQKGSEDDSQGFTTPSI
jgi:hypothetical protein